MSLLQSLRGRVAVPDALLPGAVAISTAGLGVRLDDRWVLRDVTLEVHAGELLVLLGPNGAGKSTLLNALTGDVDAVGSIRIAGTELADWKLADLARRRAALPQQNTLAFPFAVLDVVEMGRAPWRRTALEDDDEAAVAEALDRTDTGAFTQRAFPSLSGGERARVSLARVIAQRAGIVLLDEPTAALDIKHQEEVLQLARERADDGDAVVVVLHDLSLAAAYADRIALLAEGWLHSIGTPAEVLTAAAISELYHYPVEVVPDPRTGAPVILPQRPVRSAGRLAGAWPRASALSGVAASGAATPDHPVRSTEEG